jgi:two-component system, cell cycle sensor histidine kinase and response regulator CckA
LVSRNLLPDSNMLIGRGAQGLTFAFLVLCGPRYIPLVLATCLGLSFSIDSGQGPLWVRLALSATFTFGYGFAAWVARRMLGRAIVPRDSQDSILLILGAFAAPVPSVVLGSLVLAADSTVAAGRLPTDILFRWLVGACGVLAIAPAVAVHVTPWLMPPRSRPHRRPISWMEALAQGAALFVPLWALRAWPAENIIGAFCLCFVPLVWISLRNGLAGSTLAILIINLGSYLVMCGTGVSQAVALDYLLFAASLAMVGLGLGAAVTFRGEAEAALADSEAMLARVLLGARLGLWDCDLTKDTVVYNDVWAEMLGQRLDQVPPKTGWWETLLHEDDRADVLQRLDDHLAGRTPFYEAEYRMRTSDGGWKWILARGSVVARDEKGQPLRFSGTHLDLTDRKRIEAEKNRLLEIIEAAPDFISTLDLNRRVIYANPALLRLRGLPDLATARGRSMAEFRPPATAQKMLDVSIAAALEKGVWIGEATLLDQQGREVPVSEVILVQRDDVGRPAFFSSIARDISAQRKAEVERLATERKMLDAQKLESLGVLSGGIAHDFNNLLTIMLGNASLARLGLAEGSPAVGRLEQIEAAAMRAADLCKKLLAYSGRTQFSTELVDLSALVEDTSQLLKVSISKKCVLKFDLTRELPAVRAEATQLRQIMINLVINASDAIGERSGTIRVATGVMRADAAYLAGATPALDLTPGDYVWIEVSDNGSGMTQEVRARIFEPFFTTKFTGRGLGLAAVLGIVRGHRGALKVTSEPGRGSSFKLLFPAAEGKPEPATDVRDTQAGAQITGTVLVIDDEEPVRTAAARILESHGFQTVMAADGREAVRVFGRRPADFKAVLLDLTMPDMDGEETFYELRKLRGDIPVVLMSGFSENDSLDRFAGGTLAGFIAKPFDRDTLAAKLRAVVGG